MKIFTVVADDDCLWPHFLNYYARLGIDRFYAAVNVQDVDRLRMAARPFDVYFFTEFSTANPLLAIHDAQTAMRQAVLQPDEWHLVADLDEFQAFPIRPKTFAETAESMGANVVCGRLVDRIAADGSLPQISTDTDLWAMFPRATEITTQIVGGCPVKAAMIRGTLEPCGAYHYLYGQRPYPEELVIDHFKWQANLPQRLRARLQVQLDARAPAAAQTKAFLDHWEQYGKIEVSAALASGLSR